MRANTGQSGGPTPQERDEATDEDCLGAVAFEESAYPLELRIVQANEAAIAVNECDPACSSDPVPSRISDDRATSRCRDYA